MTSEITEVPEDDAEPPEVSECAEQPERGAGRSDEVLDFLVQGKRPHELPLLLREACASGDAPLARRVLRHAAPCVDTQDERHMTALHYAAANHNRGSEGAGGKKTAVQKKPLFSREMVFITLTAFEYMYDKTKLFHYTSYIPSEDHAKP